MRCIENAANAFIALAEFANSKIAICTCCQRGNAMDGFTKDWEVLRCQCGNEWLSLKVWICKREEKIWRREWEFGFERFFICERDGVDLD